MAINCNNTSQTEFSTSYFSTLTTYTVFIWINPTAYNSVPSRLWQVGESGTNKLCGFALSPSASGTEFEFFSNPNAGTLGLWRTTTDPISTGANQLISVTYNNTSVSNDPILYYNGASQSITELGTPDGTGAIATANYSFIGRTTFPYNGIVLAQLVYNRILSSTEIEDAYASKLAIPTYRGLVFAPQLQGAAGLQVFDGATLGASNTIADSISGTLGVPSGSPLGRADTYLTY